jgi:5'-deoxy-5'-methylthioadenosine phosphorylase
MLAVIGGTGLTTIDGLTITRTEVVDTPWGSPSAPLVYGELAGQRLIFLARHGNPHRIPPHRVNYRANLWALQAAGASWVFAAAAVGGIAAFAGPGKVVIPNQLIDYTYDRRHTFFEDDIEAVRHVDFTQPYCPALRRRMLEAAARAGVEAHDGGTYAATQGPRLESAAEVRRLAQDGCDIVGMTGMPEAALARELDLCYASCAVVANWAAGKHTGPITMEEIERELITGMGRLRHILAALVVDGTPV